MSPEPGLRRFLFALITSRASHCASSERGTWTAIWSPSKSALKAGQTSGGSWVAAPPLRTGRDAVFDEAACAADVEGELSREKPRNHEGPEKLERHVLRKTALVELEVRADDNDGTA